MTNPDVAHESHDILDVADYFIANADPDDGISHLKLQKLCAYAQAYQLALNGRRLFDAPLEAWTHGPVVRELYKAYRTSGKELLSTAVQPGVESRRPFSYEQLFVLETVNGYYGGYTASHLRNMSHEDFPGNFNGPQEVIEDSDIIEKFAENKVIVAIKEAFQCPPTR